MPAPSFLHCWHADLAHPAWPHAPTLSPAELARQARLRTAALQQAYGRAHSFLRVILSQYTSQSVNTLHFDTDKNGKPILANNSIHFNLSYRPNRALLAVSNAGPVGADIEPIQPLADAGALVQQLFSGPERAALQAAGPASYWPLFYLIWTRKEAYAKALGMGLSLPFHAFSVLELAAGQVQLVPPAAGQLSSFSCGAGHQGAVALLGAAVAAQHFDYSPAAG